MAAEASDSGYREHSPRRELHEYLACSWSLKAATRTSAVVLPDGCMDIVWRPGIGLVCAGPDTGPVTVSRRRGSAVVGIRFRPGAAPAMLGTPASELRDLRVPLAELWGPAAERLEEELDAAPSPASQRRLLEDALVRRLPDSDPPDRTVAVAVARLRANGLRHVNGLGGELGISERQLRRRFHSGVGYGPKMLARVLRLQRMLALASRPGADGLATLALDAGYADQAHMTAESTRLAGLPPGRLLASRLALPTRTG